MMKRSNMWLFVLFVPFAVGTPPPPPLPTNIQWGFQYFRIFKFSFLFGRPCVRRRRLFFTIKYVFGATIIVLIVFPLRSVRTPQAFVFADKPSFWSNNQCFNNFLFVWGQCVSAVFFFRIKYVLAQVFVSLSFLFCWSPSPVKRPCLAFDP